MFELGTLLAGKYRLDEIIGQGGTSVVYKAYDITVEQTVAVKVLKTDDPDQMSVRKHRFLKEAAACKALKHENIVEMLDFGEDEGQNYIVFEYINGMTLRQYMDKNGVLNPRVAVNIISQVLSALQCAHDKGILHRDIKPQNVMISSTGAVKLVDFGIARMLMAETKTFEWKQAVGTVQYMSPEQILEDDEHILTYQSDIYSVGIMLSEMLTARLPYDGDNSISIAIKRCQKDIVPPRSVNEDISLALNDCIIKAAAIDPDLRYESADAMRRDLKRALIEPNKRFAKLPDSISPDTAASTNGAKRIGLGLIVVLGVIALAFIIVSIVYNSKYIYVPNLEGKSLDAATELIKEHFTIVVTGSEASNKYPSGCVLKQDPSYGTRLTSGSQIKIILSIDADHTIVPVLTGKSLLEANNALARANLLIDSVVYDENSQEPVGTIFDQSPKANEEVGVNTRVTIYISGVPSETAIMPSVKNYSLANAVSALNNFGFLRIFIRYTSDGVAEGSVVAQNITPGISIDKSTPIYLNIHGEYTGTYYVDKALNVSLSANDSSVMATLVTSAGYEIIVYEAVLPAGTQVASFRLYSNAAGTYECVLYANEIEQKRESVTFGAQ